MNVVSVSLSVLFFGFPWFSLRVDGEVVHIDGHPPLSDFSVEDHIHHHLEGSGGIGQPKEHDRWFEESFWGEERRFPFVPLFDANIVVPPSYIELSEEGATSKAINGLGNEGRHIAVLLSPLVDGSVVLDRPKLSVFLFDEEEVGGVGAPRLSNGSPF